MKKVISVFLSLLLVISILPLAALPIFADTVITHLNIVYDTKAVAVRSDLTGRQVTYYLRQALDKTALAEGTYYDLNCTELVERREYSNGETYYVRLGESNVLLSADKEYYFCFNFEDASGYTWNGDTLPPASINGAYTNNIDWYSDEHSSVNVYQRVYVTSADYVAVLSVIPSEAIVQKGTTYQFSTEVEGTDGRVSWSCYGKYSAETTISSSGLLTVGSAETAEQLTIRATSSFNPNIYAEASVDVIDEEVKIDSVTISPKTISVYPGDTPYFTSVVTGTDLHDVEYTLIGTHSEGTYLDGAYLHIDKKETATSLKVRCTSLRDTSKYDDAIVTLLPLNKITSVSIVYDTSAVVIDSTVTGKEVSDALDAAIDQTALTEGFYFDLNCTNLIERVTNANGVITYLDLSKSDEKLSADKEYYLLFNLEDDNGYCWDADQLPAATVNGDEASIVKWYSSNPSLDGSVDVLKRVVLGNPDDYWYVSFVANGGSGDMGQRAVRKGEELVVPDCAFTPPDGMYFDYWYVSGDPSSHWFSSDRMPLSGNVTLIAHYSLLNSSATMTPNSDLTIYVNEGYGWYDISVDITMTNTGDSELMINDERGSALICTNPIFQTWAGGMPSSLSPGESHTRTLHMDTGMVPGTYTTDVVFQDLDHKIDPISFKVTVIVEKVINDISLTNVPALYAGNSESSYRYSAITTEGDGYSLDIGNLQWCTYDNEVGFLNFRGTFQLNKTYYLCVELNADSYCHFNRTGDYKLDYLRYYCNGASFTPKFGDYYFNGSDWLQIYLPYTVTKEAGSDVTVVPYASSGTLNSVFTVDGHEVTVNFDKACKLGYLSGGKYVQVLQYSAAGNSHLYIVPDDVDEVILVINGDTNLDGKLSNADSTKLKAAVKGMAALSKEAEFASDVNGDKKLSNADSTKLKAAIKGMTELSW